MSERRVIRRLAAVLTVFLGLCLPFAAIAADGDGRSQAQRRVIVGFVNFPPYYQLDADGKPAGFAVDVMNEVAKRAGLAVAYRVKKNWGEVIRALETGEIDIIPNYGITERRKEDVAFTVPVDTFRIVTFVRFDTDVRSLDGLSGRPVAVVIDNAAHRMLQSRSDIHLYVFDEITEALFALLAGKVDGFVYPESVTWKIARKAGIDHRIKVVGTPLREIKRAMAVRRDNVELLTILRAAVKDFVASPKYREIYVAWFGRPDPFWTAFRIAWTMGAIFIALIIAMAAWRYRSIARLNRALKKGDERYELVIAASNEGIWERDLSTGETYRSSRFLQILGYEPGDLDPRERIVRDRIHPEDSEKSIGAFQAHLDKQVPYSNLEFRLRRKSGEYIWVSANAQAVWDENGKAVRVAGSITDITERKQAEEALGKLSRAVEQSPASVIITDTGGLIEYVNPKFAEVTGYSRDEVIGKNPNILKSGHTSQLEYEKLWKAITAGREWRGELHNKKKNGELYWEFASISPIRAPDGTITHFLAVKEDITERKRLGDELRHSQRMEAVGQLTGGLSHDFNNLLGIISGNVELLAEKLGDGEFRDYLDPIVRATRRGAELTHRLLAFSRKQTLNPEIIRLGELCEGMSNLLKRTLGAAIEIEFTGDDGTWDVLADPGQLENALLNLAINASHAMAGGGKLTIGIENVTVTDREWAERWEGRPGEYAALRVADTGCGIPPDVIQNVFEPFFTTKEVGQGSGLGLSMVYGFARQSGGFTTIESEPGLGAMVTIYLPRADAVDEDTGLEATDAEIPRGRGETILVVEDEPDLLRLTVRQLETLGYRTLQAPDGPEALEILSNEQAVDLLLADVVLPGGVSGPQIYQEVREMRPGLKCLLMSGYAAMPKAALPEGVDLLDKPFQFAELAGRLRTAFVGP